MRGRYAITESMFKKNEINLYYVTLKCQFAVMVRNLARKTFRDLFNIEQ